MADREFRGEAWLNFLDHENIHYLIRIKDSSASIGYLDRERVKVKELFRCLDINQRMAIATPFIIDGNKCYLIPLCFLNDKEIRDLVAVISFKYEPQAISLYSKRRQIGTMFRALKTSGVNIELTRSRDADRFATLLQLVMPAFSWAYIAGIFDSRYLPEKRIHSHGKPAKTLFKYGLESIAEALLNHYKYRQFYIALKFLSCT